MREWAEDRQPSIGHLDEATVGGWTVVDLTPDWKVIFPGRLRYKCSIGKVLNLAESLGSFLGQGPQRP
jgi:hypothetical protein